MSLDTVKSRRNAVQNNNIIPVCGHWELPESAVMHSICLGRVALGGHCLICSRTEM